MDRYIPKPKVSPLMRLFGHHVHKNNNPWDEAPAWAVELRELSLVILTNTEIEMSQADDLNNAVTSLASGFTALDAAVQTELVAIAAALAGTPNPAITQAIANIDAITGKMATDAAALTASLPAATTVPAPPAPPPVVPTSPNVDPPVIAVPPVTDPNASPPNTPPPEATTT